MADWSMLPCDILSEIALKLDQPHDFAYFSAVCRGWSHASSLVKSFRNQNSVIPWFLFPDYTNEDDENPDCFGKVYCLGSNKCFHIKMPETFRTRCWGSSCGWIALQSFDDHQVIQLFNPLTKARITSLPSILNVPNLPGHDDGSSEEQEEEEPEEQLEEEKWYYLHKWVRRIVVLEMPHDDDDGSYLLIAAFFSLDKSLAFARPGDQSWTYMVSHVEDVACFEDRIYIVCANGRLLYCDIKGCGGDLKDLNIMEYAPTFRSEIDGYDKVFLLDLDGDLVMVVRSKKGYYSGFYNTRGCNVYRFDNKMKKWVEIKDIGDFAIFVGHHSSMACPTTMSGDSKSRFSRNCIYYTDDEHMAWHHLIEDGEVDGAGHDTAFYEIATGHVFLFYLGDVIHSPFGPPIFFRPKGLM